mmetsp:Transcript_29356/g.44272  ORF Transcript_29356/g.44272 Transcript_29356/m.44272 type:complete len:133 (-) Transcript_29356:10483-10881(-)
MYPYVVKPEEQLVLKVVLTSEVLDKFEGFIYLLFDVGVLAVPVTANVKPNKFFVRPHYNAFSPLDLEYAIGVPFTNPAMAKLAIDEFYHTNPKFKVEYCPYPISPTTGTRSCSEKLSILQTNGFEANQTKHI